MGHLRLSSPHSSHMGRLIDGIHKISSRVEIRRPLTIEVAAELPAETLCRRMPPWSCGRRIARRHRSRRSGVSQAKSMAALRPRLSMALTRQASSITRVATSSGKGITKSLIVKIVVMGKLASRLTSTHRKRHRGWSMTSQSLRCMLGAKRITSVWPQITIFRIAVIIKVASSSVIGWLRDSRRSETTLVKARSKSWPTNRSSPLRPLPTRAMPESLPIEATTHSITVPRSPALHSPACTSLE